MLADLTVWQQAVLLWGAVLVAAPLAILTGSNNKTAATVAGVLLLIYVFIVLPALLLGILLLTVQDWIG